MDFVSQIALFIAEKTDLAREEVQNYIEVPAQQEMGDFALPCFRLAKTMRRAPQQIAADLSEQLRPLPDFIERVEAVGGFLNFSINRAVRIKNTLSMILDESHQPGSSDVGGKKTVIVEYSSPNIAKPFHIGHGFTTILGESLARIYARQGYDVVRFNHLGDYGTQFGKLIVAIDLWVDEERLKNEPITELLRVYVKFHEEAKREETDHDGVSQLEIRAREAFRNLENGEPHELRLWQTIRDLSLEEFSRVYDRLGIHFDNLNGESFYSSRIPDVVALLNERHLLEQSEGAQVVRLDEYDLPPCIILKSDGTTIYASRDLAAVLYRDEEYRFEKNIYVVGIPQTMHFKQVFSVLDKAGCDCAKRCVHVPFGTVKFPDRKLSTREGDVIKLEDLLNEAVAKTREIIAKNASQRGEDMSNEEIDEIAEKVGLGAVVYLFLRNGRERDIVFRWEEVLDFEGDTAPYLQYTYARARSILRRAKDEIQDDMIAYQRIDSDSVYQVVVALDGFADSVADACEANEPYIIARQIHLIARQFNKFYNNEHILNEQDEELRRGRLAVCQCVCRILKVGLELLGIEAVEKM
ncbi:MAG: arginine--tRNA ligase [Fastidiosipilaceae bacterium]|jgi:arginyl-tRNA synthetase